MFYNFLRFAGLIINSIFFFVVAVSFGRGIIEHGLSSFRPAWFFILLFPVPIILGLSGMMHRELTIFLTMLGLIGNSLALLFSIFLSFWPLGDNSGAVYIVILFVINEILILIHLIKTNKSRTKIDSNNQD